MYCQTIYWEVPEIYCKTFRNILPAALAIFLQYIGGLLKNIPFYNRVPVIYFVIAVRYIVPLEGGVLPLPTDGDVPLKFEKWTLRWEFLFWWFLRPPTWDSLR